MTKEKQIEKWITLFRDKPTYYYRSVAEIHRLGCYSYDAEFDFKKRKCYADNILKRAKREIAQDKYDSLVYFCEKLKELKFTDYIEEIIKTLEEK